MDELQAALQEVSEALHRKMDYLLPSDGEEVSGNTVIAFKPMNDNKPGPSLPIGGEDTVIKAMRYSALAGGKRLRPFLTVASAHLFGVSREASLFCAAAIEFIHTYSLIHDDLPAMDNDPLRRGKPSCHVMFGEAAAILAGDALLTFAFQVLADERVHADPAVRCELIRVLATASGYRGMVGGQMMDLEAENKKLSIDEIIRLQRLKTGELFAMSCEAGAILGKGARAQRSALRGYAHDMGLAFQIADDLMDVEGTRSEAGKEVNKDKQAGKATLVSVLGTDRAREQARLLANQAIGHLEVFDKKADQLRALAEFVITRRN
jgi:farnesyl diphosphate synthase